MKQIKAQTTEPIRAAHFSASAKEFGRDKDVQAIFGLKRGTLYNLHSKGKIRGVLLRVQGEKSGVRLWDMDSIRRFILSQFDTASKESVQ